MYPITNKIIKNITGRSIPLILLILLLAAFVSVIGLLNPILYSKIIDEVIPNRKTDQLLFYLLLLVITPCVATVIAGGKKYFSAKLGDRYTGELRRACFQKVIYAKTVALEEISPAQIASRITKECGRVGEVYITNDLMTFVTEIVTFISVLITMFLINTELSLICMAAFPLSALITRFVSKRSKAMDRELMDAMEESQKYLMEAFGAVRAIKLKAGYEKEISRWDCWLSKYRAIRLRTSVVHDMNRFFMGDLVVNIIYGFIFFYWSDSGAFD